MSDSWHSYPKLYALGHAAVKELLDGPVLVEEKVDGSQFSFGVFDGEFKCRSKGKEMHPDAPEKMFASAVNNVRELPLHDGWTYRGEVLCKPKHNTLCYSRVPARNVIIFDINTGHEDYLARDAKEEEAERIGLEIVPVVHQGAIDSFEQFHNMLSCESILGGVEIEGVAIKNYARFGRDGKAMMGKFVSERFKEKHSAEWKATNPNRADVVTLLIQTLTTEARWEKAIQRLAENGELEGSPRDIGALLKSVQIDIKEECADLIAAKLTQWAMPQIQRGAVRGLPEWYKNRLAQSQFGE